MADPVELVAIGMIEKSFGVRGELRVRSLSDVPGRFEGLTRVTLEAPSGTVKEATIRSVRAMNGSYVLGMDVCSTPEEAAMFRGWTLKIPQGSAPPLPQGQYYEYELIGLVVQDETGRLVGTVEDILRTPGHHVFVVRGEDGEVRPGTDDVRDILHRFVDTKLAPLPSAVVDFMVGKNVVGLYI